MSILDQIRPCDMDRPYIFVSYSSLDKELVWQDVLTFQNLGYNVWLDERNLDKTKASWKDDALAAIEDYCCALVVFYISGNSLTSEACYNELRHTTTEATVAFHNGEVKYIAVETEPVGDIESYKNQVYSRLIASDIPKAEKQSRTLTLHNFVRDFFKTNNEKVRIHAKNDPARKLDYLTDIVASFPEGAKCSSAGAPAQFPEPDVSALTPQQYCELGIGQKDANPHEAFLCFSKAAKAGDAEAQYWMGRCFHQGIGTERDDSVSFSWYLKAAGQNHPKAQYELGYALFTGTGTPADMQKAAFWFQKSAQQGYAAAQCELGVCYYYGHGVKKDPAAAVQLFCMSATQGESDAQFNLGYCCFHGIGTGTDKKEGVFWYLKAAAQGNASALFELGNSLATGKGIRKNVDDAVMCYRQAAEKGHEGALKKLKSLGLL